MHRLQEQRAHVSPQPQPLRLPYVLTTEERYRAILGNHLPADAVELVYDFLERYKVHFHITRGRRSKLGDYRWPQTLHGPAGAKEHPYHEISVNGDLNQYMFLRVFLHEAAHLETHLKHGTAVAPHGHEWQAEYAALLRQCIMFFPSDVQEAVKQCTTRIPMPREAVRCMDAALRRYDRDYDPAAAPLHLDDLPAGSFFRLATAPGRLFQSLERRRTRWLCIEQDTGRHYTISASAEVII